MQFKKGDRLRFVKDCQLHITENILGEIISANSEWVVKNVSVKAYGIQSMDKRVYAVVPAPDIHKHCELVKASKDKHNILAGLIQTDGSVDGEKLMEKLSNESKKNSVEHPSYYNQGIECLKYINSHKMGFAQGCMVKYATRYLYKGTPIQDLEKIIVYAKSEIERLKAERNK